MFLRIRLKKDEDQELIDEDDYKFYLEKYLMVIGITPNFDLIESKIKLSDFFPYYI